MARVEIDEVDLQRSEALRRTVNAMLQHGEGRQKVLEAYKATYPGAVIPEIDAKQPLMTEIAAVNQKLADMEKARKEDKEAADEEKKLSSIRSKWAGGRSKLRSRGYTEEGIDEIEKLMETKGLLDHDDGATIFEKVHPPPEPGRPSGTAFQLQQIRSENDEDFNRLFASKGEDEGWLNNAVRSALTESRSNRR